MAEYLIQGTTLTAIASAIRTKEESSDPIPVSDMASRINAISTGVTVQRASGTFTTNSSGSATVDCGFQPDFVVLTKNETDSYGCFYAAAIPFSDYSDKIMEIAMWSTNNTYSLYSISPTRSAAGFTVAVRKYDDNWSGSNLTNSTFNYIAYKITE